MDPKPVNPDVADKEDWLICPYMDVHLVPYSRLQYHLVKCRKTFPTPMRDYRTCPFNARHTYPAVEHRFHMQTCRDSAQVQRHIVHEMGQGDRRAGNVDIPEYNENIYPTATETWEDDDAPFATGISQAFAESTVCQIVPGVTPSEKRLGRANINPDMDEVLDRRHGIQEQGTGRESSVRMPQTESQAQRLGISAFQRAQSNRASNQQAVNRPDTTGLHPIDAAKLWRKVKVTALSPELRSTIGIGRTVTETLLVSLRAGLVPAELDDEDGLYDHPGSAMASLGLGRGRGRGTAQLQRSVLEQSQAAPRPGVPQVARQWSASAIPAAGAIQPTSSQQHLPAAAAASKPVALKKVAPSAATSSSAPNQGLAGLPVGGSVTRVPLGTRPRIPLQTQPSSSQPRTVPPAALVRPMSSWTTDSAGGGVGPAGPLPASDSDFRGGEMARTLNVQGSPVPSVPTSSLRMRMPSSLQQQPWTVAATPAPSGTTYQLPASAARPSADVSVIPGMGFVAPGGSVAPRGVGAVSQTRTIAPPPGLAPVPQHELVPGSFVSSPLGLPQSAGARVPPRPSAAPVPMMGGLGRGIAYPRGAAPHFTLPGHPTCAPVLQANGGQRLPFDESQMTTEPMDPQEIYDSEEDIDWDECLDEELSRLGERVEELTLEQREEVKRQRERKKIDKKLRQIEVLKEKKSNGTTLTVQELAKVNSEEELRQTMDSV